MPAWAWLALLVAASFLVRAQLSRGVVAPYIFTDELTYSELAKSLAADGERLVRGVPASGYGIVYPALMRQIERNWRASPAFGLGAAK